jgi:hypothetical protein
MAVEYYDDIIAAKLAKWMPTDSKLRILKPDETKRLFEQHAMDTNDKPIQLPLIAMSRNNDIELLLNVKNHQSFNGLKLWPTKEDVVSLAAKGKTPDGTAFMNAIPIKLQYQLDIYTKTMQESSEYLRQYLFKLINNPSLKITIPYNGVNIEQIANIRILSTISDTSDTAERLFPGQFSRWTIQFELQDAFLYDIPYKRNWKLYVTDTELLPQDEYSVFEVAEGLTPADTVVESDNIGVNFKKS